MGATDEQMAEPGAITAISVVDSSRLSTFVISILLIVYGSFRSLNLEQENREKEKDKTNYNGFSGENDGKLMESISLSTVCARCLSSSLRPATSSNRRNASVGFDVQTIDTCQAMFLPIAASVSLLVMFLFFDSLQMVFAICTAIQGNSMPPAKLLNNTQETLKMGEHLRISFGICGRFTAAEIMSFCLSFFIVCIWVLTGHWLLMDALGMGLCVAFIALVRLPSLKVSTLLLVGLLIYDVFWVFFSSYIFSTNVMVKVATRPAENPVGLFAKKLHLSGLVRDAPKLSLPGKLVFPSMQNSSHFSMLGLGDIVMPGLLLCFVLRYDAYKKSQLNSIEAGIPQPINTIQKITYFHCSLIGYFLGLLTATVSSEVFKAAQPALLYLVPFTLLPLLTMAYLKGDLRRMWNEPFINNQSSKLEV
ncbi:signal peptide peptidase-like 3 [Octopus bimaculoides]|nr:signal peptide peptidase-like 3 [Octopus bimaculoides]